MSYSKKDLINYRIDRAEETLADARLLVSEKRWHSATNRLYYSCFYIVSAYMIYAGNTATTHSGLKFLFNKELVKAGTVSKADGVLFN